MVWLVRAVGLHYCSRGTLQGATTPPAEALGASAMAPALQTRSSTLSFSAGTGYRWPRALAQTRVAVGRLSSAMTGVFTVYSSAKFRAWHASICYCMPWQDDLLADRTGCKVHTSKPGISEVLPELHQLLATMHSLRLGATSMRLLVCRWREMRPVCQTHLCVIKCTSLHTCRVKRHSQLDPAAPMQICDQLGAP
jgi:hypothetical protein